MIVKIVLQSHDRYDYIRTSLESRLQTYFHDSLSTTATISMITMTVMFSQSYDNPRTENLRVVRLSHNLSDYMRTRLKPFDAQCPINRTPKSERVDDKINKKQRKSKTQKSQ